MAKKKNASKQKSNVESKPKTPVKGLIYSEGVVNIPVVMITTKDAFEKIYSKSFRKQELLDKAWEKAEAFRNKHC